MSYVLRLLLMLSLFWLLLSGHFDPLLLSLGALSVALVLFLAKRMGIIDAESHPKGIMLQLLRYHPWLIREIADSAIRVARIIVSSKKVSPMLSRVTPLRQSQVSRVIFANSITLTPGTVTLDTSEPELLVHALTQERAEGLQTGDMAQRIPNTDEANG
jgi:multicomponent Na+:H+ antiporter subunit E